MKVVMSNDIPNAEDLALAEIKGSHLFGLTNTAGKVLTAIEAGMLTIPTLGLAQIFGNIGPVAGLTVSPVLGLAFAAASIGIGVAAYALGNYDDKKIAEYNATQYDLPEEFGIAALNKVASPLSPTGKLADAVYEGTAVSRNTQVAMSITNSSNGVSKGWLGGLGADYFDGNDETSSKLLGYGAAIAAATSSYLTLGFAAWKNFIDEAPRIITTGAARRARKSRKQEPTAVPLA